MATTELKEQEMRKTALHIGAIAALVICTLAQAGCTSTDPFVVNSLKTLRADHEALINEYNDKVDPDLDPDFRRNELGAYDDLIDYEVSKSK